MKYEKNIKTIKFPTPAGTAKIKIYADSGELIDAKEQENIDLYNFVKLLKEEVITFPTSAGNADITLLYIESLTMGAVHEGGDTC